MRCLRETCREVMLTRSSLSSTYASYKQKVKEYLEEGKYEEGLLEAETAAHLATSHPFLESYGDGDLERILWKEFEVRFGAIEFVEQTQKVVFYNSQIVDSGALTQQYLDFFIEHDYDVLFIVPYHRNTLLAPSIKKMIRSEKSVELYIPRGGTYQLKMKNIIQKIVDFGPQYSFIHMVPYDVLAFSIFSNVKSSIRYYIVHNDHTYWLGKLCADYFLEFRNFGICMSVNRRGIAPSKIRRLPYYPIDDQNEYQGLPFDTAGKVVGLLAANPYKFMMDREKTILTILLEKLNKHSDFVVVIAGRRSKKLNQFIRENELQERFYYIGHRADFRALMENIDIYINSYPLIGGLTTQFAAASGKPIVSYTKKELEFTNAAEGLLKVCKEPITYTDLEAYSDRLSDLIEHRYLRDRFNSGAVISTVSKPEFDTTLGKIINNPGRFTNDVCDCDLMHEDDTFLDYYIQRAYKVEDAKQQIRKIHAIQSKFGEVPFVIRHKIAQFAKKYIFRGSKF